MTNLISGKEAKLAWANGEQLQVAHATIQEWEVLTDNYMLSVFDNGSYVFRLKPKTITLSGIEVPAPFEPKEGDIFYILSTGYECGYVKILYYRNDKQGNMLAQFGAWCTEDEIKQVVAVLRQVFGGV